LAQAVASVKTHELDEVVEEQTEMQEDANQEEPEVQVGVLSPSPDKEVIEERSQAPVHKLTLALLSAAGKGREQRESIVDNEEMFNFLQN